MNRLKKYGIQGLISAVRAIVKFLEPALKKLARIPFAKLDLKVKIKDKSGAELNLFFLSIVILTILGYLISIQIANCLDIVLGTTDLMSMIFGLFLYSFTWASMGLLLLIQLYELNPREGTQIDSVDFDTSKSSYFKAKIIIGFLVSCMLWGFILVNCSLVLFSFSLLGNVWWLVPSAFNVVVMLAAFLVKGNVKTLTAVSKEFPDTNRTKKLKRFADKLGFPNVKLYLLPDSRTAKSTAVFMSPKDCLPKIFFAPQVLDRCSDDELVSVMAHELGHFVQQDLLAKECIKVFLEISGWYLAAVLIYMMPNLSTPRFLILPVIFGLLALFRCLNGLVTAIVSRTFETRADLYALNATRNPVSFKNAITKVNQIASKNIQSSDSIFVSMLAMHPPISKRIEFASKWEKKNLNS